MKQIKWTNAKIKKLNRADLIQYIEQATGTQIAYTTATDNELRTELTHLILNGKI